VSIRSHALPLSLSLCCLTVCFVFLFRVLQMKDQAGKACKVCERPFTVYRWKPGPKGHTRALTHTLDMRAQVGEERRRAWRCEEEEHRTDALSLPSCCLFDAHSALQKDRVVSHLVRESWRDEVESASMSDRERAYACCTSRMHRHSLFAFCC